MPNSYHVIKYKDRPIIALPAVSNRRLIKTAIRRYQPDTPKRAMLHYCLEGTVGLGLDVFLPRVSNSRLQNILKFNLDGWLEQISRSLGTDSIKPMLVWPPEAGRGRIYVHLLRHDGSILAFAKVSLTEDSNKHLLTETETLRLLAKLGHRKYRAPAVLTEGTFNGRRYLIAEAIPAHARPFRANHESFPLEAVREYAGPIKFSMGEEIQNRSWWQQFCAAADSHIAFYKEARNAMKEAKIKICRVHGDMGPSNMIRSDNELWIVDWEQSCPDGPYLTDVVSFYLGSNRRRVLKNTYWELQNLFEMLVTSPHRGTRADILMALAFLHGAGFKLATMIIDVWENTIC